MARQLDQDERQADRVGAAGQSDEDAAAWGQQVVAANGATDVLEESCQNPTPNSQQLSLPQFPRAPSGERLGIGPASDVGSWEILICRRADSNRRPRAYETRALTG